MTCPTCGAESAAAWRPFCSRRCANVDLGRWFSEEYVISEQALDDEDAPRGGDVDKQP